VLAAPPGTGYAGDAPPVTPFAPGAAVPVAPVVPGVPGEPGVPGVPCAPGIPAEPPDCACAAGPAAPPAGAAPAPAAPAAWTVALADMVSAKNADDNPMMMRLFIAFIQISWLPLWFEVAAQIAIGGRLKAQQSRTRRTKPGFVKVETKGAVARLIFNSVLTGRRMLFFFLRLIFGRSHLPRLLLSTGLLGLTLTDVLFFSVTLISILIGGLRSTRLVAC
jgi:hypothetical protein